MESPLTDISRVIQLAVAPVFLLTAVAMLFIGAMLAMIAGLSLFLREVYLAVRRGVHQQQGQDLDDFPQLKRWFSATGERPATQRIYAAAKEINPSPVISKKARRILFGQGVDNLRCR